MVLLDLKLQINDFGFEVHIKVLGFVEPFLESIVKVYGFKVHIKGFGFEVYIKVLGFEVPFLEYIVKGTFPRIDCESFCF